MRTLIVGGVLAAFAVGGGCTVGAGSRAANSDAGGAAVDAHPVAATIDAHPGTAPADARPGAAVDASPTDAAPSLDAGSSPDAGPSVDAGPPAPVTGTMATVYVTAGGDVTVPTDLSATPVEIYIDDGSGSLVRYPGTGSADGSFSVPNVPAGATFDLRIGDQYYVSSRRSFALGKTLVQRPDAAYPTQSTTLDVDVSGLIPFQQDDVLELVSPNSDVWLPLTGTAYGQLSGAGTDGTVSGSLDYRAVSEDYSAANPLIDTSNGDDVYLEQLAREGADIDHGLGVEPYEALERIASPSSLVMTDGATLPLTATLQPVAAQKTESLVWQGLSFRGVLQNMCGLDPPPYLTLAGVAVPFPGRGPGGASADLFTVDLATAGYLSMDLGYGDPFPASWGRSVLAQGYCFPYGVSGEPLLLFSETAETLATASQTPMQTAIGQPRAITVDRQTTPLPVAEHDPLLAWIPPEFGTATSYHVIVYDLTGSGPHKKVATIVTQATSVRIPPPILEDKHTYGFVVRAISEPNDDPFGRKHFDFPWGLTDAFSGLVSVGAPIGPDLYVDGASGSDTNLGTETAPFKTITYALSVAKEGNVVEVEPGTYDIASGETFPLHVPARVELRAAQASGGVTVVGSGPDGSSTATVVVDGYIEGLHLQTTAPGGMVVDMAGQDGEVGSNVIDSGPTSDAIGIRAVAGDVGGNEIHGMTTGLLIPSGASVNLVLNNVVSGNEIGVEDDDAGADLGGGSLQGPGGNTFSCNTQGDLVTTASGITINAANNAWDHVPPKVGTDSQTDDIVSSDSTTKVVTTGATLAASPCP